MASNLNLTQKILVSLLAIVVSTVALFLAFLVGGPLVRALFGTPVGFHEHFTSPAAHNQALLAQSISLGIAFLLLGAAFGRSGGGVSWSFALWAANPVTGAIGYFLFKLSYQSLHMPVWNYEYYGIRNGVWLSLAAPIVFVLCFRAGAHWPKLLLGKLGDTQSK